MTSGSGEKKIFSLFHHYVYGRKINFKKSFDPRPWLVSFRVFAQKSIKIREWFWESLRLEQHLEYSEIDDWSSNKKASLKSKKTVLRLRISKFSLLYTLSLDISTHFIHNFKIFTSKTKICVTWLKSVANQIFLLHTIFVYNINNPTNIVYKWRKFWNSKS